MNVGNGVLLLLFGGVFCLHGMRVPVVGVDRQIDLTSTEEFTGKQLKKLLKQTTPYGISAVRTSDERESFVDTQLLLRALDEGGELREPLHERMINVVASYQLERKQARVDAAMKALLNCRLARYYQRCTRREMRERMYPCLQSAFEQREMLSEADQRFVCGQLASWLLMRATDNWNTAQTREILEGLCAVAHTSDGEHAVRLRYLLAQAFIKAGSDADMTKAREFLEQILPHVELLQPEEKVRVHGMLGACYWGGFGGDVQSGQGKRLLLHSVIGGLGIMLDHLKTELHNEREASSIGTGASSTIGVKDADDEHAGVVERDSAVGATQWLSKAPLPDSADKESGK